jgi:hypothetical protein
VDWASVALFLSATTSGAGGMRNALRRGHALLVVADLFWSWITFRLAALLQEPQRDESETPIDRKQNGIGFYFIDLTFNFFNKSL